jgi:transcriptional regulator with XRE-family HTH domain
MTLVVTANEIDRETRDGDIVRLRLDGLTYREIAEQTGVSISQAQRIFEAARARRRGDRDLEQHHRDVLNDIEDTLDALRSWVLGEPVPDDVSPPPPRDLFTQWCKALKAKREFLALDAPKRTEAFTQNVDQGKSNEEIALFLAELNIWMAMTHTRDENGWHTPPVLPPGMTERVNVNDNSSMNELGVAGSGGKGMWSMALEHPSDD